MTNIEKAVRKLAVIVAAYIYVCGMVAAFFAAASSSALGYAPLVCHVDIYGGVVCHSVYVNPSAKIIHIDPPVERAVEPIRNPPLPTPRPQLERIAPMDRPHHTLQQ